jgi:hypothetical protein
MTTTTQPIPPKADEFDDCTRTGCIALGSRGHARIKHHLLNGTRRMHDGRFRDTRGQHRQRRKLPEFDRRLSMVAQRCGFRHIETLRLALSAMPGTRAGSPY